LRIGFALDRWGNLLNLPGDCYPFVSPLMSKMKQSRMAQGRNDREVVIARSPERSLNLSKTKGREKSKGDAGSVIGDQKKCVLSDQRQQVQIVSKGCAKSSGYKLDHFIIPLSGSIPPDCWVIQYIKGPFLMVSELACEIRIHIIYLRTPAFLNIERFGC